MNGDTGPGESQPEPRVLDEAKPAGYLMASCMLVAIVLTALAFGHFVLHWW
jgi:hypothetical protein